MGESELKLALQREGATQVSCFWEQAETLVAEQRQERANGLQQLRAEANRQLQLETATLSNNLLFEAKARAMECRLHAEAAIEERLLLLARQILPKLAGNNRELLWKALHEELPRDNWANIKVHPADHKLAERNFPAATVECDELLGGGLIATSTGGTIRIDNSLSCRLLRAWPDLLPKLMFELRKLVNEDETTHSNTVG